MDDSPIINPPYKPEDKKALAVPEKIPERAEERMILHEPFEDTHEIPLKTPVLEIETLEITKDETNKKFQAKLTCILKDGYPDHLVRIEGEECTVLDAPQRITSETSFLVSVEGSLDALINKKTKLLISFFIDPSFIDELIQKVSKANDKNRIIKNPQGAVLLGGKPFFVLEVPFAEEKKKDDDKNKKKKVIAHEQSLTKELITTLGKFNEMLRLLVSENFEQALVAMNKQIEDIELMVDEDIKKISSYEKLGSFASFKALLKLIEDLEAHIKSNIAAVSPLIKSPFGVENPKRGYLHQLQITINQLQNLEEKIYSLLHELKKFYQLNYKAKEFLYLKKISEDFEKIEDGLVVLYETLDNLNSNLKGAKRRLFYKQKNSFFSWLFRLAGEKRKNETLDQELQQLHELMEKKINIKEKEKEIQALLSHMKNLLDDLRTHLIIAKQKLAEIRTRHIPEFNRFYAWLAEEAKKIS